MRSEKLPALSPDDAQVLENVIEDSGTPVQTPYANEVGSVEAEHLALSRAAQGGNQAPNNLAFMSYDIQQIDGIVQSLEDAGVGFGQEGSAPGKFVEFPGEPPEDAVVEIESTEVQ